MNTLHALTHQQASDLHSYLSHERTAFMRGGWDGHENYIAGVCHTLRMFGIFNDSDIIRWSETPIRLAYQEMLDAAVAALESLDN